MQIDKKTVKNVLSCIKLAKKFEIKTDLRAYASNLSVMGLRLRDSYLLTLCHVKSGVCVALQLQYPDLAALLSGTPDENKEEMNGILSAMYVDMQNSMKHQNGLLRHCCEHYNDKRAFGYLCYLYQDIVEEVWKTQKACLKNGVPKLIGPQLDLVLNATVKAKS